MKRFFQRPRFWIKWAALALIVIAVASAAAVEGRKWGREESRVGFEQALASFDPETTEFSLCLEEWFPQNILKEKTSDQLTPEQRHIVGEYVRSFRYEEPAQSDDGQTGQGPGLIVRFDAPEVGAARRP